MVPAYNLMPICRSTLWNELHTILGCPCTGLIKVQLGFAGHTQIAALWNGCFVPVLEPSVCQQGVNCQMNPWKDCVKQIRTLLFERPVSAYLFITLVPPHESYDRDPENLAIKTHNSIKPAQPVFVAPKFLINQFSCNYEIFIPQKVNPYGGFTIIN